MQTDPEFYKEVCRWADSTNTKTAAKWWNAIYEVIIRELFYNGAVRVPNLGTFVSEHYDEYFQKQIDSETGEEVVYKVPARNVPVFIAHDDCINDVNMQGVTKAYRKRVKSNSLTVRDYEREVRAQAMKVDKFVPQAQVEKAQEEFKKLLKKKIDRNRAKIDLNQGEDE